MPQHQFGPSRKDNASLDVSVMGFHPLSNMFPLMKGEAFAALVADIKEHGVRDPMVVFQDKLLDGPNRWRAAEAAGVAITSGNIRQFDPKTDGTALTYVISKNL